MGPFGPIRMGISQKGLRSHGKSENIFLIVFKLFKFWIFSQKNYSKEFLAANQGIRWEVIFLEKFITGFSSTEFPKFRLLNWTKIIHFSWFFEMDAINYRKSWKKSRNFICQVVDGFWMRGKIGHNVTFIGSSTRISVYDLEVSVLDRIGINPALNSSVSKVQLEFDFWQIFQAPKKRKKS